MTTKHATTIPAEMSIQTRHLSDKRQIAGIWVCRETWQNGPYDGTRYIAVESIGKNRYGEERYCVVAVGETLEQAQMAVSSTPSLVTDEEVWSNIINKWHGLNNSKYGRPNGATADFPVC